MTELPVLQPALPLRLILDEAAKRGRRHFREMYLPVALPLAFAAGLMPLAQARWMQLLMPGHGSSPNPAGVIVGFSFLLAAAFAIVVVSVLANTALQVAAVDVLAGRRLSMAHAWTAMLRPRALWTLFVTSMLVGLGCMLCVLPGLYAALLLSLTVPVMVEEGRFGGAALSRSSELARYNPGGRLGSDPRFQAFVILFVGILLNYAVGILISLPMIVIQQLVLFRGATSGHRMDPSELMASMTWLSIPTGVLGALARTVVQLYLSFALALLLFEVRRRKEGEDLVAAIEQIAPAAGV
jgi:hypothetical protein